MEFNHKKFNGLFDPFWRGEAKMLPGGYKPTNDIPAGATVLRGTPVEKSDDLTCKVAKSATILDGSDATNLHVAKGLLFVVGDAVTDGYATANVTAIDTSNSDYDVLAVDAEISGTAIYVDCTPNAVVGADYENNGLGIVTLDLAYEVLVLYKVLLAPIVDAWKEGDHLVGNPSIKLIVQ